MFCYIRNKIGFINDFLNGHIASRLAEEVSYSRRYENNSIVSDSEIASWRSSLPYMYILLNDVGIPDNVHVAFEYVLEKQDADGKFRRLDVMISGYDKEGHGNIVIIEFKQYSNIHYDIGKKDQVYNSFFGREYEGSPSRQVRDYTDLISSYNQSVIGSNVNLKKVVFLHNLNKDDPNCYDTDARNVIENGDADKVFYEGEVDLFRDYLITMIGSIHTENDVFKLFLKGEPYRSFSLYNQLHVFFNVGTPALRMDQYGVFERIKSEIDTFLGAGYTGSPRDFLIKGGPGSGKSVLAMALLKYYLQDNPHEVRFVTAGGAIKDTILTGLPATIVPDRFVYLNQVPQNDTEIVIIDEMNRFKSTVLTDFQTTYSALKVVILLFDPLQSYKADLAQGNEFPVDPGDEYELTSQYRCSGDLGYLKWLDKLFYHRYYPFSRDSIFFDFEIIENLGELQRLVSNPSFVIVTYSLCSGQLMTYDNDNNLVIEDVSHGTQVIISSYNKLRRGTGGRLLDNRLLFDHFCNGENHYGDINNIHGLEAENIIVIIGDELVSDGTAIHCSNWVYDSEIYRKNVLGFTRVGDLRSAAEGGRNLSTNEKEEMENYIRNGYRILLTRGLQSCKVYCCDSSLRDYFLHN